MCYPNMLEEIALLLCFVDTLILITVISITNRRRHELFELLFVMLCYHMCPHFSLSVFPIETQITVIILTFFSF